jgi:hypothetical protein
MLQTICEDSILDKVVDVPHPVEQQEDHNDSAANLMPMDKPFM